MTVTTDKGVIGGAAVRKASEFSPRAIAILTVCVLGNTFAASSLLMSTFTLLIDPLSRAFGWSRVQASLPLTLLFLSSGLSNPIKGYFIDRFTPRAVVVPLALVVGGVTAAVALADRAPLAIYLLFLLLGLLTPGNVPYGRAVGAWFSTRQGLGFGILGFGGAIATAAAIQFARLFIDGLGWRTAFLVIGAVQWFVVAPLVFFFLREPASAVDDAPKKPQQSVSGVSNARAFGSVSFWVILASLTLGAFLIAGISTHGVPMLVERGFSRAAAATALSALWIGGALSQPLLGYLLDRFDTARIAIPFALAATGGLLLLNLVHSAPGVWAAFLMLGLGCGGESGTTQYYISRYFGLRNFSVILGTIQAVTLVIGYSAGPFLLSLLFDRTGSYGVDLALLTATPAAIALLLFALGPYRYDRHGDLAATAASAAIAS